MVLITNDPDEGIYLADRIIPLTPSPRATLGPSIDIPLPRPRDRTGLNHQPEFKRIRKRLIEYLLQSGAHRETTLTRNLVLPDLVPEPAPPSWFAPRRRAVRRGEIKREEIRMKS